MFTIVLIPQRYDHELARRKIHCHVINLQGGTSPTRRYKQKLFQHELVETLFQ